ncbi:MAG: hypothetical protein K0S68_130 [Candidatus Saccharibacteria bacterium]|jgi:hypothetical protein|nr:hypothetical protein [Candidatus Saccharibacteria bacterium]
MHWQDLVFTAGTIIFAVALIPSVLGKDKPALATSLSTGLVLVVFCFTYASLSLWFSAISVLATASMWLIMAWQKYKQKSER